jgi:hypothetical protein
MIHQIITILQHKDYYGLSKEIDIAKGLYAYPTSFKDFKKRLKRIWYGSWR